MLIGETLLNVLRLFVVLAAYDEVGRIIGSRTSFLDDGACRCVICCKSSV